MNNEFLKTLSESYKIYLNTGSRSNEKLKVLHKFIAQKILINLGKNYQIHTLGLNKELEIKGRYIDKKVDITITQNNKIIGGVAVKFVMSNYAQNANNYFENMLGETANIRCSNVPYFQIIILPSNAPYFDKDKKITKIESLKEHHLEKYIALSSDNHLKMLHTPDKTLLCVIDFPKLDSNIKNKEDYKKFAINYLKHNQLTFSAKLNFNSKYNGVIFNDFENFINKISHYILSI